MVPVADFDRAKKFYQALRWREDADYAVGAQGLHLEQAGRPGQAGAGAGT